ncbi:HrpE/YscL family type III secretion apparatus protein [Endozoicomonas sp. Mp262]|uniref:HrpE/YscL family type III secretion apparatus protein n=1 Tax=Endozoicomonas sp. Mp262 TaxID=2919499 RepID=UPI0021D9155C
MATPVILTTDTFYVDPSCKVLKADQHALFLEAEEIIAKAREKARGIVEQAEVDYGRERERGYQEGLEESKAEQAEQMLKVVSRTINYLSNIEKAMADILLSGVKKIIGDYDQEELAVSLVKNALQHVRNEKQVTIRIAPSQYNMVKARINEILEEYKGVGFIDLVADQRLSTGDCIMESEIGVVEASVDIQLQALQKRFEKVNATVVASLSSSEPST